LGLRKGNNEEVGGGGKRSNRSARPSKKIHFLGIVSVNIMRENCAAETRPTTTETLLLLLLLPQLQGPGELHIGPRAGKHVF